MIDILGVPFSKRTMNETVNVLNEKMDNSKGVFHVVTANPEIVMNAVNDPAFMELIHRADLVTADGIGVVIGSNILQRPLPERVAGYDTIHEVLKTREKERKKTKIYALGTKDDIISLAAKKLEELYTYVEVVGYHHGYFPKNSEKERDIVSHIQQASPHLLLVGLGSPRQEEFICQYKNQLNASVAIGCGGSLDVLAGVVKRAPKVFQNMHLEWFYRLLQEPSRFKRQLILPQFLIRVYREKKKKK